MSVPDPRRLITRMPPDSVWRAAPFRLLFAGDAISFVDSQISRVVLPILVSSSPGRRFRPLILAPQMLSYVVGGLVAGAIADRFDSRAIIVADGWRSMERMTN